MTISKKITLGALILLVGVLFLPMKTWAADDPKVSISINQTSGVITYDVSEYPSSGSDTYELQLSVSPLGSGKTTTFAITSNGTNYTIASNALDYFGLSDASTTTPYILSGKLMKNGTDEVTDAVNVTNGSGSVYVGTVSTSADHLYLDESFSSKLKNNSQTVRTLDPDKTYNVQVWAKAPYYIEVYNKKTITLNEDKVSDGDVTLSEDKVSVSLSKPTIISTGTYISDVASVTPTDYPLASVRWKPDNAQLGSGTGDINVSSISFIPATKKFSWTVTGYGNYSNASFDFYIGETTADEKVGTIVYAINIGSTVPKSISITSGKEILLASTGPYTYTATFAGYTSDPTINWTLNGDAPAGCTISGTGTTGTLTIGSTTGSFTIKAADSADSSINGTKTVKIVTIAKPTTPTGADSIVYSSRTPVSYTSSVKYDDGSAVLSEHDGVTWALYENSASTTGATELRDGSSKIIAQVDAASGKVTLGEGATKDKTIYLRATSKVDATKISDPKEITITDVIKVTGIDYVTKAVTKNFVLDMSVNKNVKISPSTAVDSIDYITWSSSDTDKGEITSTYTYKGHNAGFKGLNEGITTLTPTIYYENGTYETLSGTSFKVYNSVTVESFDNNDGLKFTLPDAVYMSYSDAKNISEVTGYRIDVLNKDGNSVYNSTTSTSSKSISLSGDTVENLIENATGNLSGDTHQVKLMISPVGKSQTSGNTVTNSEENVRGISDIKTAYRVSVSGTNITSSAIYGLANHSVKITATPTSSTYKFAGWSDGNTSNPRTVTVSTNTSSNSYTATANTTGTPTSNAGNSSGGSKGSNSKLDKVPKTGESMAIYFIVMIAVISGCVAFATLFKSLTAKAAKSEYESSIDSWRGGEDGTGESHKK